MKTDQQWDDAKGHVDECKGRYIALMGTPGVVVSFALAGIELLLRRFNAGERTDELYHDMVGTE